MIKKADGVTFIQNWNCGDCERVSAALSTKSSLPNLFALAYQQQEESTRARIALKRAAAAMCTQLCYNNKTTLSSCFERSNAGKIMF